MGLMTPRCWTNDHFIKKYWNFRRETRFSRVRIFRIFENLDFWRFDQCFLYSFLTGFSLWQRQIHGIKQMIIYDVFFYRLFLDCSPRFKNIPWACRDLPRPLPTHENGPNLPKTLNNPNLTAGELYWSPSSKNIPWACRDLSGPLPTCLKPF